MTKKTTPRPVRTAIVLTAPHTHAGRTYPPGTRLVLADTGLAPDSAQWLVTLGNARWIEPVEPTAEQSSDVEYVDIDLSAPVAE